jgi:uncharacterized protein
VSRESAVTGPPEGFVPGRHAIDAYGRGGFRFAGMSHRGSILLLPSGVSAWPVASADEIGPAAFERVFAEAPAVEFLVLGTGSGFAVVPPALRARFREAGISLDVMQTGPAVRTYNVLLAENRRVGAALIAVP